MILNLETLSLEALNAVSALAAEAIGHSNGVFTHEGKKYKARRDAGGQLEVSVFFPMKDRMDRWTQTQKDSFQLLVNTAKNATDSSGRQFEFDGIGINVELLADGNTILHTSTKGQATPSYSPTTN
jgi:hypothetical protein